MGSGWLAAAHPFLPAARLAAAPAGRRYLAGWATRTELHTLTDSALERRAGGPDSLRALLGTSERLYAQLVLAANNAKIPPPWGPRVFRRYLRWAWLIEGGAQFYAGQYASFRPAVLRRLNEGARPSFPPSARDAIILGGSVFDLLDHEVVHVALKKQRGGWPADSLGLALADYAAYQIEMVDTDIGDQYALAQRYGLSGYDAAYLWLAAKLKVPLATFDRELGDAARRHFDSL